jgi:hypothetical protein
MLKQLQKEEKDIARINNIIKEKCTEHFKEL